MCFTLLAPPRFTIFTIFLIVQPSLQVQAEGIFELIFLLHLASSPPGANFCNPGSGCSEDECVSACEPGWEENDNRCYFWSTNMLNWTDAEDFCKMKGAHLASVTSTATNDYALKGKDKRRMYHLWIGGSDLEVEGVWKWADCSPWEFTFWRSGEPNNYHGAQDCINYHPEDRRWDDYQCNTKAWFLCSKMICPGRYLET